MFVSISTMLSLGVDVCDIIFDFCSCKVLANFASASSNARVNVWLYLKLKIERELMVFMDRSKFFVRIVFLI